MQVPELLIGGLLVALGASVGTPVRFFVSGFVARRLGETFPWGTIAVNVSGCLIMGGVTAYAKVHGLSIGSKGWLLAAVGFLGSYTTVSSFALQTRVLVRDGEHRYAIGYVLLSLASCLTAAGIGFAAGLSAFAGTGR